MKNFWFYSLASVAFVTATTLVGCGKGTSDQVSGVPTNCVPGSYGCPSGYPTGGYPTGGSYTGAMLIPGEPGWNPSIPLSQQCYQRGGQVFVDNGVEICQRVHQYDLSSDQPIYGNSSVPVPSVYSSGQPGPFSYRVVSTYNRQAIVVHPSDVIRISGVSGSYDLTGSPKVVATDNAMGAALLVPGMTPLSIGLGGVFKVTAQGNLYIGYRDPYTVTPSGSIIKISGGTTSGIKINSLTISRCTTLQNQIYPCR